MSIQNTTWLQPHPCQDHSGLSASRSVLFILHEGAVLRDGRFITSDPTTCFEIAPDDCSHHDRNLYVDNPTKKRSSGSCRVSAGSLSPLFIVVLVPLAFLCIFSGSPFVFGTVFSITSGAVFGLNSSCRCSWMFFELDNEGQFQGVSKVWKRISARIIYVWFFSNIFSFIIMILIDIFKSIHDMIDSLTSSVVYNKYKNKSLCKSWEMSIEQCFTRVNILEG